MVFGNFQPKNSWLKYSDCLFLFDATNVLNSKQSLAIIMLEPAQWIYTVAKKEKYKEKNNLLVLWLNKNRKWN